MTRQKRQTLEFRPSRRKYLDALLGGRRARRVVVGYRLQRALGCLAFLISSQIFAFSAEPPSETQLPGQRKIPRAAQTTKQPLPPESALPASTPRSRASDSGFDLNHGLPLTSRPKEAANLPPESVLPRIAQREATIEGTDAIADELLKLNTTEDRRPWLTLRSEAALNTIRCLTFTPDSERLCVAGDDKSVRIYRTYPLPNGETTWAYERTIRWQIQRGDLGGIFALDSAGDFLAIAGQSAMGWGGIVLADPASGAYRAVLHDVEQRSHVQRVTSVSFAPSANGLASMDIAGRLIFWTRNERTGRWTPTDLADDPNWQARKDWRVIHPISTLDEQTVLAPKYAGNDADNLPTWQLMRYPSDGGPAAEFTQIRLLQLTTALASHPETRLVAAGDFDSNLYLIQDEQPTRITGMLPDHFAVSLKFSPDGKQLIVGTTTLDGRQGAVQFYDISNPTNPIMRHTAPRSGRTFATVSANQQFSATAVGSQISLHPFSDPNSNLLNLENTIPPISTVAFPANDGDYRIAVSTRPQKTAGPNLTKVFDTEQLRLRTMTINPSEWSDPIRARGGWRVETREAGGPPRTVLVRNGIEICVLPEVEANRHTSEYWFPGENGQPAAVAVGTTAMNDIYVYKLSQAGCALSQVFRGHTGAVTCLGLSADERYLVSGSRDRSVRVWPLFSQQRQSQSDDATTTQHQNRWGAEFASEDGKLIATTVSEGGPLHLRGMRTGDEITKLRAPKYNENKVRVTEVTDSDAMLNALANHPFDELLAFDFRRGRVSQTPVQVAPAWPPIASLFTSTAGEWAYWTPAGYYDASFEGHRMFGWQINRGVDRLPDFFLAEQVRRTLERPEMMSNLLTAGSIEGAFRQARLPVPSNSQWAVEDQLRMAPQLTILSPNPNAQIENSELPVRVSVTVPIGQTIVPPKVFANGVIAGGRRLASSTTQNGKQVKVYEWQARLPADARITLEAISATESGVTAKADVAIRQIHPNAPRKRRLYLAAAAVGQYRDAQIPRLEAIVADTKRLLKTIDSGAASIYDVQLTPFLADVTRTSWNVATQQMAQQMQREATPDDLLVIMLSGHGIRDDQSGEYYYLPADANFSDVMSRKYDHCISTEDLSAFAEIPCRKLVVLDTCHSGAVQPLQQRQIKSVVRALQNDMMFTLTASQGDQEAVQSRFSRRLNEALQGAADRQSGNHDGTVTLQELGEYVRTMVMADSAGDEGVQVPTLGPRHLVRQVNFPVTGKPVRSARR